MRRLIRLLPVALVAMAFAPTAQAQVKTLTFTVGPISVPAYGVATQPAAAPSPNEDGYVVGMKAEIVDARGVVQGRDKVMLHHIVFGKVGTPDATCGGGAERFYAEGEERLAFDLPDGYGYPNKGTDRWYLLYMLMNHKPKALDGYVRYTVEYATGEDLAPVKPIWLDVRNCKGLDPSYDVPGTGKRFSASVESTSWVSPLSGRLVAGGGHLHGGGIRLDLVNSTCGKKLFSSEPTWGGPVPRPILHEPGPTKMSQFLTAEGIPVAAGQRLTLNSVYDNGAPHTRAMGIFITYLAPGPVTGCQPTPALTVDRGKPAYPPSFSFPLPKQPSGPLARNVRTSWVGDNRYQYERISIPVGTMFSWNFIGTRQHDVTLVRGPVGFSTPWTLVGTYSRTFTKRGTYELFCSLHPSQMTQKIIVR
jgi:plastocyanin